VRVRRLVLASEIGGVQEKIHSLKNLQHECLEKKRFYMKRVEWLEKELTHLPEWDSAGAANPFNAFLSMKVGRMLISTLLLREHKRLQQPTDMQSVRDEEVDETLTLEHVAVSWDILQLINAIRIIEYRCRMGASKVRFLTLGNGTVNRQSDQFTKRTCC
jgi:hypothetical protein